MITARSRGAVRVRSSRGARALGPLAALALFACGGTDGTTDQPTFDASQHDTASVVDSGAPEDSRVADTATASDTASGDSSAPGDAATSADSTATDGAPGDGAAPTDSTAPSDSAAADAADASASDGAGSDAGGVDGGGTAPDYSVLGAHATAIKGATVSGNTVHCIYPSDAAPSAGFPGVAFAHGFQLNPPDYDQLLTHIASWGFVVCSTDYPNSLFSFDHRNVATALTNTRAAMAAGTIAGVPKVDATHIAAAGHSAGGKGAVMAVLADAAFVAALTFDPVDGNPSPGGTIDAAHPKLAPTETAKLTIPMGYFGATQSHCTASTFGATPCAPTGLDAAAFFAGTPTTISKYLWTVWDFGHMQFLDNPNCGFTCSACAAGKSALDPRKVAIKSTAVAFLERYVRGDASAQSYLDGAKRDANVTAKNFWDGKATLPACN